MFKNWKRAIRKGVLGLILAGGTIFSAPVSGCDATGVKDASGSAARLLRPGTGIITLDIDPF